MQLPIAESPLRFAELSREQSFSAAAARWLEMRELPGSARSRYIAISTLHGYRAYVRALENFFGALPLSEIQLGHLREYQQLRAASVGPNKIRQELGLLIRIMKRAGAWTGILADGFEHVQPEQAEIPRALTVDQEELFFRVAGGDPAFRLVYLYSLLALGTTAAGSELRSLRLGDVDLVGGMIYIRRAGAKNRYRIRTIPLMGAAQLAAEQLMARAQKAGAREAQHYLLPWRAGRGPFLPGRPMTVSGLKKAWNEVRRAAGLPWLRIHDLRHTAITRLAEAGTPIPVIMSMAGHISRRMQEHYTHVSVAAQRTAIEAAAGRKVYSAPRPRTAPGVEIIPFPKLPASGQSAARESGS